MAINTYINIDLIGVVAEKPIVIGSGTSEKVILRVNIEQKRNDQITNQKHTVIVFNPDSAEAKNLEVGDVISAAGTLEHRIWKDDFKKSHYSPEILVDVFNAFRPINGASIKTYARVNLVGIAGTDANTQYFANRGRITNIKFGTKEKYGEFNSPMIWHTAAFLAFNSDRAMGIKKGDVVSVFGRLVNSSWKDDNGQRHSISEIIVSEFTIIKGTQPFVSEHGQRTVLFKNRSSAALEHGKSVESYVQHFNSNPVA